MKGKEAFSSDPATFDRSFSNCNFFFFLFSSLTQQQFMLLFSLVRFILAIAIMKFIFFFLSIGISWISEREREQKTARKCNFKMQRCGSTSSATALLKWIFHRLRLFHPTHTALAVLKNMFFQIEKLCWCWLLPYKIFTFFNSFFFLSRNGFF